MSTGAMGSARLMTLAVLTGALLLFGMEPMVGRMLVPFFGSSVSTWLTALMFFQVVLFGGYLYAHLVAPRIGRWHLAILLLPLINLPIGITAEISPEATSGAILWAMARSIGLPFFVLSTTAVVLQLWWSRSKVGEVREPYALYAASNGGSLIALLGYPFIVEPLAGLGVQSTVWTVGYAAYAALIATSFFMAKPDFTPRPVEAADSAPPTLAELALWATLAALPSGFLLAVTSVIASEVGSFPMVWVFPLAVYLGTFVLIFRDRPIGMSLRHYWPEITAFGILGFSMSRGLAIWVLVLQLVLFSVFCMAAHGELYARRPKPRWLTRYYLAISFGGGVGGTLVNFGPPVLFDEYWEYPLIVVLFGVLFAVLGGRALKTRLEEASPVVGGIRVIAFQLALGVGLYGQYAIWASPPLHQSRNFYGIFRVIDRDGTRMMVHGATDHGSQFLDPAKKNRPIKYFHPGGCLHDTYDTTPAPRTMAVLGLGAGVVGLYGSDGDILDFFEIDPDNERIAREWFSFLDETPAEERVLVGDGRFKLQTEGRERYDLIHMDAFSGDGIPTHLLTTDALQVYTDKLADDGILLFHISNRYYDLRPVVKSIADTQGLHTIFSPPEHIRDLGEGESPAICAAVARNPERLERLIARDWTASPPGLPADATPWTDDYVNMLWPLYWGQGESYLQQTGGR